MHPGSRPSATTTSFSLLPLYLLSYSFSDYIPDLHGTKADPRDHQATSIFGSFNGKARCVTQKRLKGQDVSAHFGFSHGIIWRGQAVSVTARILSYSHLFSPFFFPVYVGVHVLRGKDNQLYTLFCPGKTVPSHGVFEAGGWLCSLLFWMSTYAGWSVRCVLIWDPKSLNVLLCLLHGLLLWLRVDGPVCVCVLLELEHFECRVAQQSNVKCQMSIPNELLFQNLRTCPI